jgi:hypothetical protein
VASLENAIASARNYTAGNGISISEDGTISVTFAHYTGNFEGNGEVI